MNFLKIIFLWTGVLTWYAALVLLIARVLHGPTWSQLEDEEDEFEAIREAARWN